MTVQKTYIKNKYIGDGKNTLFPITFEWPKDHPEFIQVWVKSADGKMVQTDNFALQLQPNTEEWNVVYPNNGEPLEAGDVIVVARELPLQQILNLVNQGPYFAEDIEVTFDEVVMMIQQINERVGRSFKVGVDIDGETSFDTTVPIVPGKTFRVNDEGTGFEATEDPAKVIPVVEGMKNSVEAIDSRLQHSDYKIHVGDEAPVDNNVYAWVDTSQGEATGQTELDKAVARAEFSKNVAEQLKDRVEYLVDGHYPYVTPQMFGAVGDGITDDTHAIQNCFDRCEDGTVVLFPKGAYYITDTLTINKNIYIKGSTYGDLGAAYPSNQLGNLELYGSVIFTKNKSNITLLKVSSGIRGGISDISVLGEAYWMLEHEAPTTANTYFDKRTGEIWQENVTGIDCSLASSGYRLSNVHVYQCSAYGIKLPTYGQCDGLNVKLCKVGILAGTVDNMVNHIKIQSCEIGYQISTNGCQVHNGRIEECVNGVYVTGGIDINISGLTLDQISKAGIFIIGNKITIDNTIIARSGQNTCTYNYANLPEMYKHEATGIEIIASCALNTRNVTVHRTKYDDSVTTYYCPLFIASCNPRSDNEIYSVEFDIMPYDFGVDYRLTRIKDYYHFGTDFKGTVSIRNHNNTYLLYQYGNSGVDVWNSYSTEESISKEPAGIGEIRNVKGSFYIATSAGTEGFVKIANPKGNKNVTFTATEDNVTTDIKIVAQVTGDRVVGCGSFKATSSNGWGYQIATFNNCDRDINSHGVITDGTNFYPVNVQGKTGGSCTIRYNGDYSVASGTTYKLFLM